MTVGGQPVNCGRTQWQRLTQPSPDSNGQQWPCWTDPVLLLDNYNEEDWTQWLLTKLDNGIDDPDDNDYWWTVNEIVNPDSWVKTLEDEQLKKLTQPRPRPRLTPVGQTSWRPGPGPSPGGWPGPSPMTDPSVVNPGGRWLDGIGQTQPDGHWLLMTSSGWPQPDEGPLTQRPSPGQPSGPRPSWTVNWPVDPSWPRPVGRKGPDPGQPSPGQPRPRRARPSYWTQ